MTEQQERHREETAAKLAREQEQIEHKKYASYFYELTLEDVRRER